MTMHSSYWPGFPYQRLTEFYDVIVPIHLIGAGRLPEGPAGGWSEPRTVELPAAVLNASGQR